MPILGQSGAAGALNTSFKESFKNPWTTIPRPMNRFVEIPEHVYERQEHQKQDLQRVLQEQIEEKKKQKEEEKRKQLEEEQRFEAKLLRDRQELADRETKEREEAANKIKRAQQAN